MNTRQLRSVVLLVMAAVALSAVAGYAAGPSPFVGHWQAIDVDGSDIRLTIGGPPSGPFAITWTESYISFCNGGAGILSGTGMLNEGDPNLLEADLTVECFATGEALEFHLSLRYHPNTNTLSTRYEEYSPVIVFLPPGRAKPSPPSLGLRVNYGHEWVESFYESGHTAWVTVTESDGTTVKATAELLTEPKDFWDDETGFQTVPEDWNPVPPDIQPYDWVYAWMDNGASAQVQIGDISGVIDLEEDSIDGAINALWFSVEVDVECFPWGAPEPQPDMKLDSVQPDGADAYSCSWLGEWNIQPGQDVGVGYFGPDGHWVANAFYNNARIIASAGGDWMWTTDFAPGAELTISVYEGEALIWSDSLQADESGFVHTSIEGLEPGHFLTVSDGQIEKGLLLENISMEVFNTHEDIMAGTAPPGRFVWAAAGPEEYQEDIGVIAHSETGAWEADFSVLPYDITEDMRTWSYAQIFDDDFDTNEASPPPSPEIRAWLGNERVEGYQWPLGALITLEIFDPSTGETFTSGPQQVEGEESWTYVGFSTEGWSLQPGQEITMWGGGAYETHAILPVSITTVNPDLDRVEGTASDDGRIILCIYQGGCDPPAEADADSDGSWVIDHSGAFDIQPGFEMDATEFDDDGDGTSFYYWIPWTEIIAFPEADQIFGYGWPEGSEVHLSVGDLSQTATVQGAPWNPDDVMAFFDFGTEHDMMAGDVVTLSGSGVEPTHTVQNLAVLVVNEAADTVMGTADPSADVHVWVHEYGWTEMTVTADGSGSWLADFAPFDLVVDMCGRAEIRDGGGNATAVDWCVAPQHWVAAFTYDLAPGSWSEGEHSYNFNFTIGEGPEIEGLTTAMTVSTTSNGSDVPVYDGYVLLRPGSQRAWTGSACEFVSLIHPDQPTRFVWGWVNDDPMTYAEAVAHFAGISVQAHWDEGAGGPVDLVMGEIMPSGYWGPEYLCSLTEHP